MVFRIYTHALVYISKILIIDTGEKAERKRKRESERGRRARVGDENDDLAIDQSLGLGMYTVYL